MYKRIFKESFDEKKVRSVLVKKYKIVNNNDISVDRLSNGLLYVKVTPEWKKQFYSFCNDNDFLPSKDKHGNYYVFIG